MSNSKSYHSQYGSPNIIIVPTVSCSSTASAKNNLPTTHGDDNGKANQNLQYVQTIRDTSRNNKYKTVMNTNSWASNYLQSIGQPHKQNIHKTLVNIQTKEIVSTTNNLIRVDSKYCEPPHLQNSVMNNNMEKEVNNKNEYDKIVYSLLSSSKPTNENHSENKNEIKLNLLGHKYSSGKEEPNDTYLTSPQNKKRKIDTHEGKFHTFKINETNKEHTAPSAKSLTNKMLSSEMIHKHKKKIEITETKTSKMKVHPSSSPRNKKKLEKIVKTCSKYSLKRKLNISNVKHSQKSLKSPKLIETRKQIESKTSTHNSTMALTEQITNKSETQQNKTSTPIARDSTENKIKTTAHIKSVVQITDKFDLAVCSDDLRHKLKRKYREIDESRDNLIITVPNDKNTEDETSPKKSQINNEYYVCDGDTRINVTIQFFCKKPKDPQINLNMEETKNESHPTPNVDISFLDDLNIDDIVECLKSSKENLRNDSESEVHDIIRTENNDSLSKIDILQSSKTCINVENDINANNINISNIDVSEDYSQNKPESELNEDLKFVFEDVEITNIKTANKNNTENIISNGTTSTEIQKEPLNYDDLLNEGNIETNTLSDIEIISNSLDTKYVVTNDVTNYISTQNIDSRLEMLPSTSLDNVSLCKPSIAIEDGETTNFHAIDKDSTYNNNYIDTYVLEKRNTTVKNVTILNISTNSDISFNGTEDSKHKSISLYKSDDIYSNENKEIDRNKEIIDCKTYGNVLTKSGSEVNVVYKDEMILPKELVIEIEKITEPGVVKETNNDTIDSKICNEIELINVHKNNQSETNFSAEPTLLIETAENSFDKNKCLGDENDTKIKNNISMNIVNVVYKDEMILPKEPVIEIEKIIEPGVVKETNNDTIDSETSNEIVLIDVHKNNQSETNFSAEPTLLIETAENSFDKNKCLGDEFNTKIENNIVISQVIDLSATDCDEEGIVLNKERKTPELDKNKNTEQSEDNTEDNISKLDTKHGGKIVRSPLLKTRENTEKDMAATNKYPCEQLKQDLKIRMLEYLKINYDIGPLIHNGKYSRIFKCKDHKENSYVVKLLRNNKPAVQKEQLLMNIQKDIPKENLHLIFTINSFGVKGQWCFLMEYYPKNLKDVLKQQQKPFHIDMVQRLSRQLISAVFVLRNNNVVHSNIKPAHILLNNSLSDLKLCGIDEMHYVTDDRLLPNIGTTNYRAPEVILGCPDNYRIDVWSTALVMYEMATCTKLFSGIYNNDILYKQMCTLGRIPIQMLEAATFRDTHFFGTRFMRRVGPFGKSIDFVDNFFGSNRIPTTLMNTQKKIWGDITPQAKEKAVKKVNALQKLLKEMLKLNPHNRLPIEFAYVDSFIFGNI